MNKVMMTIAAMTLLSGAALAEDTCSLCQPSIPPTWSPSWSPVAPPRPGPSWLTESPIQRAIDPFNNNYTGATTAETAYRDAFERIEDRDKR